MCEFMFYGFEHLKKVTSYHRKLSRVCIGISVDTIRNFAILLNSLLAWWFSISKMLKLFRLFCRLLTTEEKVLCSPFFYMQIINSIDK